MSAQGTESDGDEPELPLGTEPDWDQPELPHGTEPEVEPQELPRGILVPLLTPFDEDGEIDRSAFAQLVDFYLRAGVHGLFALGSAGQGPAMRADQRRTAAELIIDRVRGRIPVVIHVGTADIQTTVQLARHAATLRPAALAVSPPYYYSDHTPYEIIAHFAAVAEAANSPLLIYDTPRYSGITFTTASAFRTRKAIPSVTGIIAEHVSLDGLLQHLRTVRAMRESFSVFSGAIECLLPTVPYGLAGVASAPCSPFPELCVALWNAVLHRHYEEAFERQRQLNDIAAVLQRYAATSGRGVYREVLRQRGVSLQRYPRWPSQELDEPASRSLYEELQALGAFSVPQVASFPFVSFEEEGGEPGQEFQEGLVATTSPDLGQEATELRVKSEE